MKRPVSNPEIKESLSGTFLIKKGNEIIAGFRKKEHAEMFLKIINEKDNGNRIGLLLSKQQN
jgi:hypothetical protein